MYPIFEFLRLPSFFSAFFPSYHPTIFQISPTYRDFFMFLRVLFLRKYFFFRYTFRDFLNVASENQFFFEFFQISSTIFTENCSCFSEFFFRVTFEDFFGLAEIFQVYIQLSMLTLCKYGPSFSELSLRTFYLFFCSFLYIFDCSIFSELLTSCTTSYRVVSNTLRMTIFFISVFFSSFALTFENLLWFSVYFSLFIEYFFK